MKHLSVIFIAILFICCNKDQPNQIEFLTDPYQAGPPNSFEYAFNNRIQEFVFSAGSGLTCINSEAGVEICINTNCFELNGAPYENGNITLEYVEIFSKGDMAVTNKATDGIQNDQYGILDSGGEFYTQAYADDGTVLTLSADCNGSSESAGFFNIASSLTGYFNENMTAWEGSINNNENLLWSSVLVDGEPAPVAVMCDSSIFVGGGLDPIAGGGGNSRRMW